VCIRHLLGLRKRYIFSLAEVLMSANFFNNLIN
jgi:hypothetical protein